uniref:Uncharacterized protein n=1 Tax=Chromera velia CCMP2878 TaxID=1169474 RepID=A0A0G4FBD8_9ALVE|eukprot:Cvel_3024.t1-p1 / transcript=Cvel_3024.t1 / gene=Cvel_3024 / organism=Chromera_velia_CCMP2878 / gene_product=hypothetical protein / transcript_product=hypothetical protein / location=Cvel_scaffold121:9072-9797(+) / protein_length=242 / sequence_SO=supercontig / SO=protein_coding / is_pseudo=false
MKRSATANESQETFVDQTSDANLEEEEEEEENEDMSGEEEMHFVFPEDRENNITADDEEAEGWFECQAQKKSDMMEQERIPRNPFASFSESEPVEPLTFFWRLGKDAYEDARVACRKRARRQRLAQLKKERAAAAAVSKKTDAPSPDSPPKEEAEAQEEDEEEEEEEEPRYSVVQLITLICLMLFCLCLVNPTIFGFFSVFVVILGGVFFLSVIHLQETHPAPATVLRDAVADLQPFNLQTA